jgi:sugar phosphate isomerase/epimerase
MIVPILSLQLYSLRREFEQDAEAALRSVSSLGFDGVELAGDYGWPAARWIDMLGEACLVALSAHVRMSDLEERFDESADYYKAIGCTRLILPSLPRELRSPIGYSEAAHRINAIAANAKDAGLLLGYHNHSFEFEALKGGSNGMQVLFAETDPTRVFFEFDTYWLERAHKKADDYLAEHFSRVGMIHAKDLRKTDNADVSIGEGDIDFSRITTLARANHWPLVVEFEGENAPEAVKRSADYLKTLL